MLFILWLGFKVNISNGVYDFTLFKILKDLVTLTLYTLLDTLTLNLGFSFQIGSINFNK
jgi:hypothetical protein